MKAYDNEPAHGLHERVQLMLPWYLNGTLDADQHTLAEEHCRDCVQCAAAVEELQKIKECHRQSPVPAFSAEASFNRLIARFENEAQAERAARTPRNRLAGLAAAISSWTAFFPPKLAAALVLLLCLAPAAMLLAPDAEYRTLSSADAPDAYRADDIRVLFADNLDAKERMRLLAAVHGEIVSGPSPRGLYLIRIEAPSGASADIAQAIAALRREPGVLFAAPALPSSGSSPAKAENS